ncbi:MULTISPECIES: P1 family peptidase [Caballeronia]|jgi:D-aminopeptidase|uniref:D-aminopeptidase n=1 Tax=Caballeronia zhejiangensis TaxID=871203 RepID=A0A656QMC2_9BURK|nr:MULTISPECIES: P1 family peptidase [Caballeronia]EKS66908.1 peptidase S58 DmpA [Burkholderia sp. SJ98]KDR30668.1 D-aminopeptidase [Caballeronia zhejiangensis]MDR5789812.1 P1 family peptidase [Caballeronia sp. LP003]
MMHIGSLVAGPRGTIADVAGVTVGHCTLAQGAVQTGVTVIRPHDGDVYRDKVPAAACVINGFGKSVGLVQIDELGVIETPIALTNTFGVGTLANAQIRAAIAANPRIGREDPSVNPLVFECNDGYLNDMQALAIHEAHYTSALEACSVEFERGAVGAGRGMSCFELKGGMGSASRVVHIGGDAYTTGALVLANFGKLQQLIVEGEALGRKLQSSIDEKPEQGSIIMLIATDAPLDARQLRRLAMRAAAGLARTGSVFGHGSGDISLAFTTAYTVPHDADFIAMPPLINDARLDPLFQAAADATEQAILDALYSAETVAGRNGHRRISLKDALRTRP